MRRIRMLANGRRLAFGNQPSLQIKEHGLQIGRPYIDSQQSSHSVLLKNYRFAFGIRRMVSASLQRALLRDCLITASLSAFAEWFPLRFYAPY
jgi:hypothetical protein